MPDDGKICSFDCIYCEAGYNVCATGEHGLHNGVAAEGGDAVDDFADVERRIDGEGPGMRKKYPCASCRRKIIKLYQNPEQPFASSTLTKAEPIPWRKLGNC